MLKVCFKKPLLFVISFLSCLLPLGFGTTVEPPSFEELVKQAEIIFVGKVTAIRSVWEGVGQNRCIRSYVTLEPLKVLKGNPATPYVLSMVGGTVGDKTLEIVDVPKFKVGETNLLFIEHNGTQFMPLVGIMHGFYKLEYDAKSGEEIVLNHQGKALHSTSEIDTGSAGQADAEIRKGSLSALRRSELEHRIRSAVNSLVTK